MRLVIVLAVLLLVPAAASALPTTVPVAAAGLSYASPALVVPAGTTVEWIGTLLPHTVTTSADAIGAAMGVANDRTNSDADPDSFHADLPMGTSFAHTFNAPGTYTYYCELHYRLGMVGTVTVV